MCYFSRNRPKNGHYIYYSEVIIRKKPSYVAKQLIEYIIDAKHPSLIYVTAIKKILYYCS